jgi:hypothetical protein
MIRRVMKMTFCFLMKKKILMMTWKKNFSFLRFLNWSCLFGCFLRGCYLNGLRILNLI